MVAATENTGMRDKAPHPGTSPCQRCRGCWVVTIVAVLAATVSISVCGAEPSADRRNWFDTPFGAATTGLAACPRPEGPLISEEEMRRQAHGRIERGTSCWLAKKCEDSSVYRRDPEIQQRVLRSISADAAFATSSVWVTTERRYVTLQGCVRSASVKSKLLARVRAVEGVEQVFDQLIIGTAKRPRWTVDPAWTPAR
jgi:BON domain